MGLEEDIKKNIADVAARATSHEQKKAAEAPRAPGAPEYREIETIGADGKSTVKQVVEKHSGLHYNEESEKILGKRKNPVNLTRGVIYDANGHAMALGGSSSGDSRLEKL